MTLASGDFTQTGSGTFSTGTGVISLNGDITVASAKSLNFTGGASNFDQSASSGTFKTGTGVSTFNSTSLVLAGNSTVFDMTGTGTLSLNTTTNRDITTGMGLFTMGGILQVNGASLNTNQTTFNLLNATATTLNIG